MKRLILVTIAVLALTVSKAQSKEDQPEFRKAAEKITALLYHLENSYVDSVELEKVVDEVIREVLGELDPHSVYIPADDVKRANEGLEGNFEGIGIQFNILRDTITVVSPISGGPSESLGIMAGDKIVSIDGENVAGTGVTNSDVTSSLRGTKGTEVTVGIRRRENSKVLIFDIVRDEIPLYSLDAFYMATDKIGYIKINRFSKTTMDEFHVAIKS
jgi:carboxyl-terminal processing protease